MELMKKKTIINVIKERNYKESNIIKAKLNLLSPL